MHHINSSYIHGFLAVHLQNSPALATCVLAFHRHPSSPMLKQPPGEHERDGCMNGAVNIQKIKICINMYSLICICIFTYVYLCIYIFLYVYIYLGKLSRPQPRWGPFWLKVRQPSPFSGLTKAWSKVRNDLIDWWHEATLANNDPVLLIDNAPDRSITDPANAQSIRIGPSESPMRPHTYWQGSAQSGNQIVPPLQRVINEFTVHKTIPAFISIYLNL